MCKSSLNQFDGQLLDGLEFCAKAYALFESIRNEPEGVARLRKRVRLDKKLIEEILPICKYVQANYRLGRYISVRWVNGSQQYDAEVFQRGALVSQNYYPEEAFLEVTCSMNQNEYLMREFLNSNGVAYGIEGVRRLKNGLIESNPVGYTNKDFIDKDLALILGRIEKKASLTYPDETTLIIDCKLHIVYYQEEWKELMARVQSGLPKNNFREIYLYDTVGQYSFSIYQTHSI